MPSLASFLFPSLPWKAISPRRDIQEHYDQCRRDGTGHKMAEMFALQSAPALKTDTRWMGGHEFSIDADTQHGGYVLNEAKEAGVSTRGKVYCGGLASYPGDPSAWVDGLSEAKRIAAAKGLTLEDSSGTIYKAPDTWEPPADEKPYQVAPDILEDRWQDALEADPGIADKKDAKEALAESLAGRA